MNASPVLREMDREDNRRMAHGFADAFARQSGDKNAGDFFYMFLTVIEAALAVADVVLDSPKAESQQMIDEFVFMQSLFIKERTRQIRESQ